jgi:hypothetical protein
MCVIFDFLLNVNPPAVPVKIPVVNIAKEEDDTVRTTNIFKFTVMVIKLYSYLRFIFLLKSTDISNKYKLATKS